MDRYLKETRLLDFNPPALTELVKKRGYEEHGANLSGIRRVLFRHVVRTRMNDKVSRIRRGEWQVSSARGETP
jgi:hypothetical protein